MDGDRFDALAQALTGGIDRRRTLSALLGAAGTLAWSLGGRRLPAVEGKPKRRKKCKGGKKRCGKACVDLHTNPAHCGRCGTVCGAGEPCLHGKCCANLVCGTTCCKAGEDTCLTNQDGVSCAQTCTGFNDTTCSSDCSCSNLTTESDYHCIVNGLCAELAACTGTESCPVGFQCQLCGGSTRCARLCGTL